MHGEIPPEFRSDGWVIKQNAERLLKALEQVLQNYSTPINVAIVKNTSTMIKNSIPDEAEPLLQIQSLDIKTVKILVQHGIKNTQELVAQTPQTLTVIGINEAKAKRILKKLEKYQINQSQLKLISDESTVKEYAIDTAPVDAENKTVLDIRKEPLDEFIQNEESQDIVKELIEKLETNPDNHPVYLIAGYAEIEYSGRKDNKNEGQRLVIIKSGGTIIVHAMTGLKPLNYQAKGAKFKIQNHDNRLIITSENYKAKEKLIIKFNQIPKIIKPFSDT